MRDGVFISDGKSVFVRVPKRAEKPHSAVFALVWAGCTAAFLHTQELFTDLDLIINDLTEVGLARHNATQDIGCPRLCEVNLRGPAGQGDRRLITKLLRPSCHVALRKFESPMKLNTNLLTG